ncbi:acyltransferase family protein [Reinekea sp. G2M2-21]|uniref:acyltransferase family protein n=1 Tax=Reinekea sp. G2M2-21 TaxID=2788942 RepID=UPI0018ABCB54|nr:acyltransferase family protein [Reinekea sp. G2M2-21]
MISRIYHIDVAKGLSIFFVALYHSKVRLYLPDIVEPMALFRMPLFFFLSGVFLKWDSPPKQFFLTKTEALLKPYFIVLFFVLLFDVIFGNEELWPKALGILYGNGDTIDWAPMWFLPHLFTLYLFGYLLIHYFKFHTYPLLLIVLILSTFLFIGSQSISLFWYKNVHLFDAFSQRPGLPFSLDLTLTTSVYFILGFCIRQQVVNYKGQLSVFVFASLVFAGIWIITDAYIDLNKRIYTQPFFATIGAFCGIYCVIYVSSFICRVSWLRYLPLKLGEASLYILIFHSVIQRQFYSIFSEGITNEVVLMAVGTSAFFASIMISIAIKYLVRRSNILSLIFSPFHSNVLFQRLHSHIHHKKGPNT